MNHPTIPPSDGGSKLKEPAGWFAAGQSFRLALTTLSDGAFKLFAYICLQADRRTGRFAASHKELAAALGKSKRIIGRYVMELESREICEITPARNQYARTGFEISEAFWPYQRSHQSEDPPELLQYIECIREVFVTVGCTSGKFGAAEVATAKGLYQRRIPVAVINDAILMAACRKYDAWLSGRASEPIQTLRYIEPVIAEIQSEPFPPGYSNYLRRKVQQFAGIWSSAQQKASCPAVARPLVPSVIVINEAS